MATIAADGRPVTVATWYLLEADGTILLGLDAGRARLDHLRRDPRVSLTALAQDDWYTHVSVQGRIGSIVEDEGLRDIDRLSQHYTGQPYRNRERPRVSVHLTIERWHGWSSGSAIGD
jgi:PPOX class probable F420-dependent enzyme